MMEELCGILLDQYNKPPDQKYHFATFIGSLAACDAETTHSGHTRPVSKSEFKAHYIKPKSLTDSLGGTYPGKIVRFELRGIKMLKARR